MTLSSAWSITASVGPPRTAFLDFPLGHTAGRPGELAEQTLILRNTLGLIESAEHTGEIEPLPFSWPAPWKDDARALKDHRSERYDTPQYQHPDDEAAVLRP